MGGAELLRRMRQTLEGLLLAERPRLPTEFCVSDVYETDRFMSIVVFVIEPREDVHGIFDCSDVWDRLRAVLAQEYEGQLGASVAIDAPARFRGPQAVLSDAALRRDIEQYRSSKPRRGKGEQAES